MAYWLLRSEPDAYSWDDLVRDGETEWNGVRNATARIHLKAMVPGDRAIFYHSNTERACVGVMEITRAWQPDGDDGKWASVAVKPVAPLPRPVPLADIKAEPKLAEMMMLKQSRLSCSAVTPEEWAVVMHMAGATDAAAA
ncbi:EVE domain-containing protein [Sphingomonas donggukensis]|uniref:EVE domain-containing protein n=1 Tax=Sphingomonas donggukensis TaxID=2949093 RepID=A0ABY4TU13_9SPHN|nr:EVE domain-containing protein [Sphingomonas donggukensis]URW74922.1 EVE domain-containing protein [Sphingomonas donggukensis]